MRLKQRRFMQNSVTLQQPAGRARHNCVPCPVGPADVTRALYARAVTREGTRDARAWCHNPEQHNPRRRVNAEPRLKGIQERGFYVPAVTRRGAKMTALYRVKQTKPTNRKMQRCAP